MTDIATRCASATDARETDARAAVPDICREARQTVVDQIRGNPPTTVLGVLVDRGGPIALSALGETLGKKQEEIEWTVEVLEDGDLCARLVEQGQVFVAPFAPYSLGNA
jgi:hypothetical protein